MKIKSSKSKIAKLIICMLTLAITASVLSACGVDDIDISKYEDQVITLKGLKDKDIKLTIADLKAMDCVTETTESTSDKIGKVRATGPFLETVLKKYGAKQTDFSKIIFYAGDGYNAKIDKDFLKKNDLILAFGVDKEPLTKDAAPLRLIIPESDSAYWIRMITKIEFVK